MLINVTPIASTTHRQPLRARTGLASNPKLAAAPAQQNGAYDAQRDPNAPRWSFYA